MPSSRDAAPPRGITSTGSSVPGSSAVITETVAVTGEQRAAGGAFDRNCDHVSSGALWRPDSRPHCRHCRCRCSTSPRSAPARPRPTRCATTIALAQRADELGFTRVWVAEHHGMPGIASSAPAVLISAIAGATDRIRVGSGGVMLPNHAPLVVAEQFGTLAALYPGRIDLGPRTGARHRSAHRRGPAPQCGPAVGRTTSRSSSASWPASWPASSRAGHPYATRRRGAARDPRAADLAARLERLQRRSWPACSACRSPSPTTSAARTRWPRSSVYRERASARPQALPEPYAMVTVQVVCAETDDEARPAGAAGRAVVPAAAAGPPGPVPTAEQAAAHRRGRRPSGSSSPSAGPIRRSAAARRWPSSSADLLEATEADELMITVSALRPGRPDPLAGADARAVRARATAPRPGNGQPVGLPSDGRRRDSGRVIARRVPVAIAACLLLAAAAGCATRNSPSASTGAAIDPVEWTPGHRPDHPADTAPTSSVPAARSPRPTPRTQPGRDDRAAANRPAVHGRAPGRRHRPHGAGRDRAGQVGSVFLAGNSTAAASQTAAVARRAPATALPQPAGSTRLFIATDQEGGDGPAAQGPRLRADPERTRPGRQPAGHRAGRRARPGAANSPRPGSTSTSRRCSTRCPSAAFGARNPPIGALDREFGYSPAVIAASGTAFVQGLSDAGVDSHGQALSGARPGHRQHRHPIGRDRLGHHPHRPVPGSVRGGDQRPAPRS